jgi:hypothetical protein
VQYSAAARKVTLRVDDGHELDQYLFSSSSPLTLNIDLRGFKPPAGKQVPLTMRVFDVDQAGAPGRPECAVEVDNVSVNGTNVGQLSGADSQWSIVSLNIPAGVLTSGINNVAIDIDVLAGNCWAVQVDWATVELPFAIAHTQVDATEDVSIKRGKTDDVISDPIWKRKFKADGTLDAPSPDDPIADKISGGSFGWGAREFTYKYTLDAWRDRPTFDPKVEYAWEISGGGPDSGGYQEEHGWDDDFTVKLPDKIGKYALKVTLKVSLEDELLTTEVRTHTLYVILDSPVGKTTVSRGADIATGTPRTAWLDIATDWASGKDKNVDILEALNTGAYGGGTSPLGWQYGYLPVGPQFGAVELIENGRGKNGDCFVFRDVWRILGAHGGARRALGLLAQCAVAWPSRSPRGVGALAGCEGLCR